jgi:hypothetical protein
MNNTLPTFFEVQTAKQQNEIDRLKGLPYSSLGTTITDAHFNKVVLDLQPSESMREQLMQACMDFNALTGAQQADRTEAHLAAHEDFCIFVEDGYAIIQHEPTFTQYRVLGYDALQKFTVTYL